MMSLWAPWAAEAEAEVLAWEVEVLGEEETAFGTFQFNLEDAGNSQGIAAIQPET
jgi:hypothetical protein